MELPYRYVVSPVRYTLLTRVLFNDPRNNNRTVQILTIFTHFSTLLCYLPTSHLPTSQ
jgi:hypothetical protein